MGISVSVSMQKGQNPSGMETRVTTLGSGVAFLKIEMGTSIWSSHPLLVIFPKRTESMWLTPLRGRQENCKFGGQSGLHSEALPLLYICTHILKTGSFALHSQMSVQHCACGQDLKTTSMTECSSALEKKGLWQWGWTVKTQGSVKWTRHKATADTTLKCVYMFILKKFTRVFIGVLFSTM